MVDPEDRVTPDKENAPEPAHGSAGGNGSFAPEEKTTQPQQSTPPRRSSTPRENLNSSVGSSVRSTSFLRDSPVRNVYATPVKRKESMDAISRRDALPTRHDMVHHSPISKRTAGTTPLSAPHHLTHMAQGRRLEGSPIRKCNLLQSQTAVLSPGSSPWPVRSVVSPAAMRHLGQQQQQQNPIMMPQQQASDGSKVVVKVRLMETLGLETSPGHREPVYNMQQFPAVPSLPQQMITQTAPASQGCPWTAMPLAATTVYAPQFPQVPMTRTLVVADFPSPGQSTQRQPAPQQQAARWADGVPWMQMQMPHQQQ